METVAVNYDRDIKYVRWAFHGLAVGNLWSVLLNLWGHNWFIAIAAGIWFLNILVMLGLTKAQQVTRDRCRLMEAGLYAMREHIDTEKE